VDASGAQLVKYTTNAFHRLRAGADLAASLRTLLRLPFHPVLPEWDPFTPPGGGSTLPMAWTRMTSPGHANSGRRSNSNTEGPAGVPARRSPRRRALLAAIGICPFAAMGAARRRPARVVTECDQGLGRGRAGSRYWVRPGGDAVAPDPTQMEKSVLGPATSPFT